MKKQENLENVNTISPDGWVYLIRLDSPLGKNSYYCGWALNTESRLFHHRNGTGSAFLREANRLGISYCMVGEWPGGRWLERSMKNTKNLKQFDPTRSGARNPLIYPFQCKRRYSNLPDSHPALTIGIGDLQLQEMILSTPDSIEGLTGYSERLKEGLHKIAGIPTPLQGTNGLGQPTRYESEGERWFFDPATDNGRIHSVPSVDYPSVCFVLPACTGNYGPHLPDYLP